MTFASYFTKKILNILFFPNAPCMQNFINNLFYFQCSVKDLNTWEDVKILKWINNLVKYDWIKWVTTVKKQLLIFIFPFRKMSTMKRWTSHHWWEVSHNSSKWHKVGIRHKIYGEYKGYVRCYTAFFREMAG